MRLKRLSVVLFCSILAMAHGHSFLENFGLGSSFLKPFAGWPENKTLESSNSSEIESTVTANANDSLSTQIYTTVTANPTKPKLSDNLTTAEILTLNETSTQKDS